MGPNPQETFCAVSVGSVCCMKDNLFAFLSPSKNWPNGILLIKTKLWFLFQYSICRKKLESKREGLKILMKELEQTQIERDVSRNKVRQLVSILVFVCFSLVIDTVILFDSGKNIVYSEKKKKKKKSKRKRNHVFISFGLV